MGRAKCFYCDGQGTLDRDGVFSKCRNCDGTGYVSDGDSDSGGSSSASSNHGTAAASGSAVVGILVLFLCAGLFNSAANKGGDVGTNERNAIVEDKMASPKTPTASPTIIAKPAPIQAHKTTELEQKDLMPQLFNVADLVGQALTAFKSNQYDECLKILDSVNKKLPNHMNEFRALALFAKGEYHQASLLVRSFLPTTPGWDWKKLIDQYQEASIYTNQIRSLEAMVKKYPNDKELRFLLAYHYIAMGYLTNAAGELRSALTLNPNDSDAAAVLRRITLQ